MFSEMSRAGVRMRRIAPPRPALNHPHPWSRQKPHLGRQLPRQLAPLIEILRQFPVEGQDCLAARGFG
jgi:hypothetical protein